MSFLFKFSGIRSHFRSFSSSCKFIDVTINENTGFTTVAMKRAPVNSLNTELLSELSLALDSLKESDSKGLILTSKIPNIFTAGLDLMEFYKCDAEKLNTFWITLQNTWLKLYSAPYATAALINGHSPAGGCLLAMSCDYRVMMGPNFSIGLNEAKIGIPVPFWFIDVMKSIIGARKTELSVLSGRMYRTDDALAIGLIDEIAENQTDADSKIISYLNNISTCSAASRAPTKNELRYDNIQKFLHRKDEERKSVVNLMQSSKTQKKLELYFETMKKKN